MTPEMRTHVEALELASGLVELGAGVQTVRTLTGLSRWQYQSQFGARPSRPPLRRFGPPADWYEEVNLICKVEASLLASMFDSMRASGRPPAQVLLAAYRCYRGLLPGPAQIGLDRAYQLVSHVFGLWKRTGMAPELMLRPCHDCRLESLTTLPGREFGSQWCAFCKLRRRYPLDMRLQQRFQADKRDPGAALALGPYFAGLASACEAAPGSRPAGAPPAGGSTAAPHPCTLP